MSWGPNSTDRCHGQRRRPSTCPRRLEQCDAHTLRTGETATATASREAPAPVETRDSLILVEALRVIRCDDVANLLRRHAGIHDLEALLATLPAIIPVPVGELSDPLAERFIIRKSPMGCVYIHHWLRSDPDDMHDHPWAFTSIVLAGGYWEVMPGRRFWRAPGDCAPSLPPSCRPTNCAPRLALLLFGAPRDFEDTP